MNRILIPEVFGGLVVGVCALALTTWGAAQIRGGQVIRLEDKSPIATCASLNGMTLDASAIKVKSGLVKVTSAEVMPAKGAWQSGTDSAPIYQPATPEYCKVTIVAASVDSAAPVTNIQINLPSGWNQKAIHLGGSALLGNIPASMQNHRNAPEMQPANVGSPITKGYIELASDGGHQRDNKWLTNEEAIDNYAHAADKKAHDAAVEIAKIYYGSVPRLMYFMGSSGGGREAMSLVQIHPEDYDGVFAQVPFMNTISRTLVKAVWAQKQLSPGTWLPASKAGVINDEVLRQCDGLDGIVDGTVSAYEQCSRIFVNPPPGRTPWAAIRCMSGTDEGPNCLSDAQITTLNMIHSDTTFGYPLGYDTPGFAAFGVRQDDTLLDRMRGQPMPPKPPVGRDVALLDQTQPMPPYEGGMLTTLWRGAVAGDPAFPQLDWDPVKSKDKFIARSTQLDGLNPDLSKFLARGGKLILKSNTADNDVNWRVAEAYYTRVVSTMGQAKVDSFMRYYIGTGQGHSMSNNIVQRSATGAEIPSQHDMVDVLDKWVAGKVAPADAIMLKQMDPLPPFAVTSTRPMCRYPNFPKYVGGDKTQGGSYLCAIN
jgi:hypothetical protein